MSKRQHELMSLFLHSDLLILRTRIQLLSNFQQLSKAFDGIFGKTVIIS
jgi:hypothetical protein